MAKTVKETPYNNGRWTVGRFRGFITSTIRGGFRRWGPKYDVLKAAFTGRRINPKSKREANHYRCAICGKDSPQSGVQVDHIEQIGHCDSWDLFIERLFCEANNLQVLCKKCHKNKTKKENKNKSAS